MSELAVFHMTHWKAGSQWVRQVLTELAPQMPVVSGMAGCGEGRFEPGTLYSPVYMSRPSLTTWFGGAEAEARADFRLFYVVRDLRDTLVSWYFSLLHSHGEDAEGYVVAERARLQAMSKEEGLLYLLDSPGMWRDMVVMQLSWVGGEDPVFRYEDLIADEESMFARIVAHCGLDATPDRVREVVRANSFERRSGRARGVEDRQHEMRKGVAGDWRNHATPRVAEAMDRVLGGALAATGYAAGSEAVQAHSE